MYPKADIEAAFASTVYRYTFDGTNVICPSLTDLIGVYNDIYVKTTISQPVGNTGFSCHNGTLLEDMGEDMQFMLSDGEIITKWRLVRQITPQVNPPLPIPGNSPNGTVGFVTTFCSYGTNAWSATGNVLDVPSVIRVG